MTEQIIEKVSYYLDVSPDTLNFLNEYGLISEKNSLKLVLKYEYKKRLSERQKGTSCFDIHADLALEYHVTEKYVQNAIYSYNP